MVSKDNSNDVSPAQDQQDIIIRSSTELGSPMPCRGSSLDSIPLHGPVEHPCESPSISLPPSSPFWDQMLPSSPSPRTNPDLPINLDRYAERGFSEDLALPPRQIKKPFRFLDLPAEIRNMIYELVFYENRAEMRGERGFHWLWYRDDACYGYMSLMKSQWHPPQLSFVSKRFRQETMSLYYAVTNFDWYWDPLRIRCECGQRSLQRALMFLSNALDFITGHNLQIRSITLRSPERYLGPGCCLADISHSVRCLARLWQLLDQTDKEVPTLREVKFASDVSLAHRLFDLAGCFESFELDDEDQLSRRIRDFLHHDSEDAQSLIRVIEGIEENERNDDMMYELELSRLRRKRNRQDNKTRGPRRWNGVLRSRQHQEASEITGPERWDGVLRGRAARGKK